MTRPTKPAPKPTGSIRSDELLPLSILRQRLGLGARGWSELRKAGLPVKRLGRSKYVLGADVLQFFAGLPAEGGPV